MNNRYMLLLVGFLVIGIMCGCRPQLAQVEQGEKEASWDEYFRKNYSGYNPPRNAPPAIQDNRKLDNQGAKNEGFEAISPSPEVVASEELTVVDTEEVIIIPVDSGENSFEPIEEETPAEASVVEYTVVGGDSLTKIAKKFYKKASKYHLIVDANPELKGNPNKIKPGMKLIIPQE